MFGGAGGSLLNTDLAMNITFGGLVFGAHTFLAVRNASILNLNNICAESICALIDKDKNGPSGPNRMR